MKEETFGKFFKKYYPLGYESLEKEFMKRSISDGKKDKKWEKTPKK